MQNPKELLESFIARNNDNPLTSKKFILEYKKEVLKEDYKYSLSLKVKEEQWLMRVTDSVDNEVKNELMLYSMMLEYIFEVIHNSLEN